MVDNIENMCMVQDVDVSERSMNGDEEEEQVMNDDEEVESVEEEEESERVDSVGECESDEENDSSSEDEEEDDEEGGGIIINGLHELGEIDWDSLTPDLVMEFKFPSLKVAFIDLSDTSTSCTIHMFSILSTI